MSEIHNSNDTSTAAMIAAVKGNEVGGRPGDRDVTAPHDPRPSGIDSPTATTRE